MTGRNQYLPRSVVGLAAMLLALLLTWAAPSYASVTVLVGEPFGRFGTMMPVGHAAIYLDHVCADGPLKLKMCGEGDQPGVVVARYAVLGKYDWMATPIVEFLYAVERMEAVPPYIRPAELWEMREAYRVRHLLSVVPNGRQGRFYGDGRATGAKDLSEWWETAGMAYNRRVWAYELASSPEQDEAFVQAMNDDANLHRYRLNGSNCADFAADVVNFYYPGAVHTDHVADLGLMTPKQVLRSVSEYGKSHPESGLKVWEVPQVAGSLRRSRPVRSVTEGLLKTKRYLFTMLVIQPEVPLCFTMLYLKHGRWRIGEGAVHMPDFAGTQESEANVATNTLAADGQAAEE